MPSLDWGSRCSRQGMALRLKGTIKRGQAMVANVMGHFIDGGGRIFEKLHCFLHSQGLQKKPRILSECRVKGLSKPIFAHPDFLGDEVYGEGAGVGSFHELNGSMKPWVLRVRRGRYGPERSQGIGVFIQESHEEEAA